MKQDIFSLTKDVEITEKAYLNIKVEPISSLFFNAFPYRIGYRFNTKMDYKIIKALVAYFEDYFDNNVVVNEQSILSLIETDTGMLMRDILLEEISSLMRQKNSFDAVRFMRKGNNQLSVFLKTKQDFELIINKFPKDIAILNGIPSLEHLDNLRDPKFDVEVRSRPYHGKFDYRVSFPANRKDYHGYRKKLVLARKEMIEFLSEQSRPSEYKMCFQYGDTFTIFCNHELAFIIPMAKFSMPPDIIMNITKSVYES